MNTQVYKTTTQYLYDYLVNTAKANIAKYKDGTITPKSKVTLYTDPTVEDHQPVISIEKETPFDMALRKYITKVTTKEGKTTDLSSSATTTRNPSIDTATIDTEYTATYKHRKNRRYSYIQYISIQRRNKSRKSNKNSRPVTNRTKIQ